MRNEESGRKEVWPRIQTCHTLHRSTFSYRTGVTDGLAINCEKQVIGEGNDILLSPPCVREGVGDGRRRGFRPAASSEGRHVNNPTVGRVGLRRGQTKRIISSPPLHPLTEETCQTPGERVHTVKWIRLGLRNHNLRLLLQEMRVVCLRR